MCLYNRPFQRSLGISNLRIARSGFLEASPSLDETIPERPVGGLPLTPLDGGYAINIVDYDAAAEDPNTLAESIVRRELAPLAAMGSPTQVAIPHGLVIGFAELDQYLAVHPRHEKLDAASLDCWADVFTGDIFIATAVISHRALMVAPAFCGYQKKLNADVLAMGMAKLSMLLQALGHEILAIAVHGMC